MTEIVWISVLITSEEQFYKEVELANSSCTQNYTDLLQESSKPLLCVRPNNPYLCSGSLDDVNEDPEVFIPSFKYLEQTKLLISLGLTVQQINEYPFDETASNTDSNS